MTDEQVKPSLLTTTAQSAFEAHATKPSLVVHLEGFLESELRLLGSKENHSEGDDWSSLDYTRLSRLHVFQKVFGATKRLCENMMWL